MGRTFREIIQELKKVSQCQPMCPWCGSEEAKSDRLETGWFNYKCCECHNSFRSYRGWIIIDVGICFFIVMFCVLSFHATLAYIAGIISLVLFIWHIIYLEKMPYKRVQKRDYIPEEFLGVAEINWFPHKQGGLRFPDLTIWNHYILGVCFVDTDGKPISQTGYIRMDKIMFKKTKKIYQITDNIKYDNETMSEFIVFYKRKQVGTGHMLSDSNI